jgi:hypothetical protein
MYLVTWVYNRGYKKETSANFLADRYIYAEKTLKESLRKSYKGDFKYSAFADKLVAKFGLPLSEVHFILSTYRLL